MKRVLVIGSPGTGKTTFSKKLAAKTSLPLIHIDYYYHDPTKNFYTDKQAWVKLVTSLAAKEKWIMDGNYGNSLKQRMVRADTIFHFDFPRYLALWGAFKRRMTKPERDDMPEGWTDNGGWAFYVYIWNFKKKYAEGNRHLFDQNKDKQIITFKNRRQAKKYLRML